ncbi:MAG: GNAT family N-acetyltransferase [bacterium]|nr:GNAT family N-acetyltransferase [bacterium]
MQRLLPATGLRGGPCLSHEVLEGMGERMTNLAHLTPPIPEGVYYVQFLSVAPGLRGRGLGERLLRIAFERAREQGYEACQLDVVSDNRAVGFYQRMGMEILTEGRVLALEQCGVHSHYRMVKVL